MPLAPAPSALGTDDALLVEATREFAMNELLPLDRAWDVDESSAFEVVPKLSEMGLMNLLVPQELGGLGCSYRTYAAILHELARASPATCVTVSVHNMVGHIIGERAGEVIHQAAMAIHLNATIDQMASMIHAFPTFSEGIAGAANSLQME